MQAADRVYKWDGATTFSSVASPAASSLLRDVYWPLDDYLVFTDLAKLTVVSRWTGTTWSAHPTGLANPLYAKYGAVKDGRLWLANITESNVVTPHMIIASTFESATSFDTTKRAVAGTFTTGNEAFYMLTPDLKPVNAMTVMHTDLIISTEDGKLYRLDGTGPSTYKWTDFYPRSNAVGNESLVNAGNDVFYMRTGGNIESVLATQNYGDVSADDISRWIPNTVFQKTGAIAIYDQSLQRVLFFIDGKILVLFKDILYGGAVVDETGQKAKLSPWSVYRTNLDSALRVEAAKYMRRPGTTNYTVFFGGPEGQVYDLNGTGLNGDASSTTIVMTRRIRFLGKEQGIDYMRNIPRGVVQYVRLGVCDFNIEFEYSGEYNNSNAAVRLKGGSGLDASFWGPGDEQAYWGGNYFWGTADKADFYLSHQDFDNVGRGRVMTAVFSTDTNVRFQVNHVEL